MAASARTEAHANPAPSRSRIAQAPVLHVSGISKRFGGLQALTDVGITIERGQVYGLIGPNGAGKTTFFNVLTGLYTPDTGSFELAGKRYRPTAVHTVAKAGIARTFQNIRLFSEMTALENVMVGRHVRTGSGLLGAIFRTAGFKREEEANRDARARTAGLCECCAICRCESAHAELRRPTAARDRARACDRSATARARRARCRHERDRESSSCAN